MIGIVSGCFLFIFERSSYIFNNLANKNARPEKRIYPIYYVLDKNGDLMIDTKADRLTRIPLDEYIPVTIEAALMIFGDNNCDYEAEYAVTFLNMQ